MTKKFKIAAVATVFAFMLIDDVVYAQVGRVHRATRRRTAVVVGTTAQAAGAAQQQQAAAAQQQQTTASQQQAAASKQKAAAAEKKAAAAEKKAAAAEKEAAAAKQQAALAKGLLPLGTVADTLPEGCVATPINGQQFYKCGDNYYRAVFEGNTLVYVTAEPK